MATLLYGSFLAELGRPLRGKGFGRGAQGRGPGGPRDWRDSPGRAGRARLVLSPEVVAADPWGRGWGRAHGQGVGPLCQMDQPPPGPLRPPRAAGGGLRVRRWEPGWVGRPEEGARGSAAGSPGAGSAEASPWDFAGFRSGGQTDRLCPRANQEGESGRLFPHGPGVGEKDGWGARGCGGRRTP